MYKCQKIVIAIKNKISNVENNYVKKTYVRKFITTYMTTKICLEDLLYVYERHILLQ